MKTTYHLGRDLKGNKTVLVCGHSKRVFSIQTNGNLPRTHRDGIGEWTPDEVQAHVRLVGTKHQKLALGI